MKLGHFIVLPGILLITACDQERLLFHPEKLPADHRFSFNAKFREILFPVDGKTKLHGLLFQTGSPKGLVFYLHGNAGSIDSWGGIAETYLKYNYDFFILDYRGYGKSEGKISSEKQLFDDINTVYDSLAKMYDEKKIIVTGYSIGSGLAAQVASVNDPGLLILKAPYYNMSDLARQYFTIFPSFLISYKLKTNEFIKKVKCPVVIFHGDRDEVIYYGSSLKLKEHFKKEDRLIVLHDQRHNGINENRIYLEELKKILE